MHNLYLTIVREFLTKFNEQNKTPPKRNFIKDFDHVSVRFEKYVTGVIAINGIFYSFLIIKCRYTTSIGYKIWINIDKFNAVSW